MKKIFLASVAVVAMTATASAADLAPRYTKAPAPVAAAVYDWSGFYIGGHVGYGWGSTHSDIYNTAGVLQNSGSANRNGVFGGGQIGYNVMLSPNWLIGIEADISGADIKSSNSGCSANGAFIGCSTTDSRIDYFGTVRGRLGYAANNVLIYGTGGLLWAHMSADRTITSNTNPAAAALVGQVAQASSNPTGWTAGGGIEWGFAPNWSAKVEYLYGELDTNSSFVYNFRNTNADRYYDSHHELHTVKIGINYRFGGPVVARY